MPHNTQARQNAVMALYSVNPDAVRQAERLIDSRQYVLDSDWGKIQPKASERNAFLKHHSWEEYARWHLGLTDGAADQLPGPGLTRPAWDLNVSDNIGYVTA